MSGLFIVMTLSGCASLIDEDTQLLMQGRQNTIIEKFERKHPDLKNLSLQKIGAYCNALQVVRSYRKLERCIDAYEAVLVEKESKQDDLATVAKSVASIFLPPTQDNIDDQIPLEVRRAILHTYRANFALDTGKYERALEEALKGAAIQESLTIGSFPLGNYGQAGLAHAYLGNPDKAREYMKLVDTVKLQILFFTLAEEEMGKTRNQTNARICLALKDFACARQMLERQTSKHASENIFDALVFALDPVGGAVGLASEIAIEAEFEAKGFKEMYNLNTIFMASKIAMETGSYADARKGYEKFLAHHASNHFGYAYYVASYDMGRLHKREGNRKKAIEFYRRAVSEIERQRSTIGTEASKIGFVGDKQEIYRELIQTLIEDGQLASAFEYVERAKARALIDMLAAKKDFSSTSMSNEEVGQLLASLEQQEIDSHTVNLAEIGRNQPGQLRGKRDYVTDKLVRAAPEVASLVTVRVPGSREIQKLLPRNETLLEYYADGDSLIAFVVNRKSIKAFKLDGKLLADDISQFRQAIRDYRSKRYLEQAQGLYDRLLAPVAKYVKTQNLLIVPHGSLHYLPFNALHDGKRFLIDRKSLRILPSASVMQYLKRGRIKNSAELLALGNPDLGNADYDLKFAQDEAVAITKGKKRTNLLLRKKATESAVKQLGGKFRRLHFASHGEFNADDPLNSGLLLAKDASNDGTLTVNELYSTRLNADLVTLSACQTGLGRVASGDDVVGFTRGFLYAGANSIVSSLWSVDDKATYDLMTRFYRNLGKYDKRTALRKAQLATRGKYQHPIFWAAFQLTGNPS